MLKSAGHDKILREFYALVIVHAFRCFAQIVYFIYPREYSKMVCAEIYNCDVVRRVGCYFFIY